MTAMSDRMIWVLAAAGSVVIHGVAAGTLVLLPAPHRTSVTETAIALHSVPTGQPENVAAWAVARHVEPEATVIASNDEPSNIVDAQTNAGRRQARALKPAEVATHTISPTAGGAIAEMPPRPGLAAVASSRSPALEPAEASAKEARKAIAAHSAALLPATGGARKRADLPALAPAAVALPVRQRRTVSSSTAASLPAKPTLLENTTTAAPAAQNPDTAAPVAQNTDTAAPVAQNPDTAAPVAPVAQNPDTAAPVAPVAQNPDTAAPVAPVAQNPDTAAPVAQRQGTAVALAVTQEILAPQTQNRHASVQEAPAGAVAQPARSGVILDGSRQSTFGPNAGPKMLAPTRRGTVRVIESIVAQGSSAQGEAVAVLVPRKIAPSPARQINPYEQVLQYLADYEGDGCFLALPSPGLEGRVRLDGFSVALETTARFAEQLVHLTGIEVETTGHTVSADQCRALSFARSLATYPAPGLQIRPSSRSIASGDVLVGSIKNVHKKMLYLLVIDDEGKVQEIQNLFQDTTGQIGFAAPMTLTRGKVQTEQLLIAIASDEPLETFASHEGQHAEAYFAALADEIAWADSRVDFGFTTFFVR
jgi:hypothetical protein